MELVCLESPYAGDIERNVKYARACMLDCLKRGEAPFASHLLYTQEGILRDDIPAERSLGIVAGQDWAKVATKSVFYIDLGVSCGMVLGFQYAKHFKRKIEFRSLPDWQRFLPTKFPQGIMSPLYLIDHFD